jgi:hypothetical protein
MSKNVQISPQRNIDQNSLINLNLNIIQNFIDLKIATENELIYLEEDLKDFFIEYLDPKLKNKNNSIDDEAIKMEKDIYKLILNLRKRIKKLNKIIEEKILIKNSEFYKFYCDILKTYEEFNWLKNINPSAVHSERMVSEPIYEPKIMMNLVDEESIIEEFLKKVKKHKKPSYPYLSKNTTNESFEDIHKRLENLEYNLQVGNALLDNNLRGKDRIIINPPQDFRVKNKGKKHEEKQYMITDVEEIEQKFLESTGEEYEEYKKQLEELTEKMENIKMNTNPSSSHNIKVEFSSDEEQDFPYGTPIPDKVDINQYRKTQKRYTGNIRKQSIKEINPMKSYNEPIHTTGIWLDLDCVDKNKTIETWIKSTDLAIQFNKWETYTAFGFIEHTFRGTVSEWWRKLPETIKGGVKYGINRTEVLDNRNSLNEQNIQEILKRFEKILRIEFLGNRHTSNEEERTQEEYNQGMIAMENLKICDMCELERYTCKFEELYYVLNQGDYQENKPILRSYFTKLPFPWGIKLLKEYEKLLPLGKEEGVEIDSLGSRIEFTKRMISMWCREALENKKAYKIRKNSLCCYKDNGQVEQFGCYKKKYKPYKKYKRKFKNYKKFSKKNFKPHKKYFKKRNWNKKFKPRNIKKCRCFICNEEGHIAPQCPKKKDRQNIKTLRIYEKFQDDSYIEPIEYFEDLSSECSSIYELDTSSSEEEYEEIVYMNQEIQQSEIEIETTEEVEDSIEGINQEITFDIKKYAGITKKILDLQEKDVFHQGFLGILPRVNKTIVSMNYKEMSINIEDTIGKVRIPIITKEWVKQKLSKIPENVRNKLKCIELGGIQVMIKGFFREGMNIPIEIYCMDNRILQDPIDALLGTVVGNLVYQKIIFTIKPNYAISLSDENIDQSLNLYYRIGNLKMLRRSKAVSISIKSIFAFSTSHHNNLRKINDNIIIHKDFEELAQYIPPRKYQEHEVTIPEQIMLDFHKQAREINSEEKLIRRNSVSLEGDNLIARFPSRQESKMIRLKNLSIAEPSSSQYYIKTRYVNQEGYKKNLLVLIDTGADKSHVNAKFVSHLTEFEISEPYIFKDYLGNNLEIRKYVKFPLILIGEDQREYIKEIILYKDELYKIDRSPILLGMNFLEKYSPYKICQGYLKITVNDNPIIISRIDENMKSLLSWKE